MVKDRLSSATGEVGERLKTKALPVGVEGDNRLPIRPQVELHYDAATGRYVLHDTGLEHDVMLVDISSLLHMADKMLETFGTGATVILRSIGESIGTSSARSLVGVMSEEKRVRRIFSSVSKWGFGRYELISFKPGERIRFRLFNVLARPEGPKDEQRKHHFQIGFYKGYFSAVFKRDVNCQEVRCMNFGDECCEFEVSTTNRETSGESARAQI